MMIKAIFLDRDGIINIDKGYVHKIEDFEFVPGIIDLLKESKKQNFIFFIITNQSGIARGYYSEEDFLKFNKYMLNELLKFDIKIEKVKFCPHHPKGIIKDYSISCSCRKPSNGMIKALLNEYNIDIEQSYLIGDKESDILAGKSVGLKTILVSKNNNSIATFSFKNVKDIVPFFSKQ